MTKQTLTLAAAACCGICLYFLDADTDQPPTAATVEQTSPTPTAPVAEETVDPAETVPESAEQENAVEAVEEVESNDEVAFVWPFPERSNLFQAPKRRGSGRIDAAGSKETSVELLGFVNVHQPEVILSIDGLATTIAEGGEQSGIEVISIRPPAVFLRRGKQPWQLTLEN